MDPLPCPICSGSGLVTVAADDFRSNRDHHDQGEEVRCTADFCAQGTLACSRCPEAPDAVVTHEDYPACARCFFELTGECVTCDGDGFVERGDRLNDSGYSEAWASVCEDCDGKGRRPGSAKERAA